MAAILGHGIAYYLAVTPSWKLRWRRRAGNVAAFLGLSLAFYTGLDTSELLTTLVKGTSSAYSRDMEREADVVGPVLSDG